MDLRLCRSLLFVPASNDRALAKARDLEADMVIVDLEDSVPDDRKAGARSAALGAIAEGYGGRPVAIRINAPQSPHYGDDVVAVRKSTADYVIVPKAEAPKQCVDAAWLTSKPVLAMIETPLGVIEAAAIAPATRGLIAGTNDLGAALGLPPELARGGLTYALQRIVIAARAGGAAAFDGVCNQLEAGARLETECAEGRQYGFDGKSVIHPDQIVAVNRAFTPSKAEVERARRLLESGASGAVRHEGQMVEAMHLSMARAVLAKARIEAAS